VAQPAEEASRVEALLQDHATLFLVVGLILISVDLFVVGISPLMFIAVGSLLTSAILWTGWVDGGLLQALLLAALMSVVAAVLGWGPLRWMQGRMSSEPIGSDLAGRRLDTTGPVDRRGGTIRWSGTEWQARLDPHSMVESLPAGRSVRITGIEGVTLILTPDDGEDPESGGP
jgi:membrane protein implicated in regulation of membrane protease activity